MRKQRFTPLFFFLYLLVVLLPFGGSWAVPGEDLAETPYDESEILPYQKLVLTSIHKPQKILSTIPALLKDHDRPEPNLFLGITLGASGTRTQHFAEGAAARAFLCFFLC